MEERMPFVTWSPNMTVGVKKFDDQHKRLFDLINSLHDAMGQGKGQVSMQKTLEELVAYTKTHFADEEREMKRTGYPGLDKQIVEHGLFVEKVSDLAAKHQKGMIGLAVDTMEFLSSWLKKHIAVLDKQYADHFASKGVK
jgi:hemerythrin